MQSLAISPDDKYAVSFTNNNQILVCAILTGECQVLKNVARADQDILGVAVSTTQLVMWTAQEWRCFTTTGSFLSNGILPANEHISITHMELDGAKGERFLIWKTDRPIPGVETEEDMTLEIHNSHTQPFPFHSAIALSASRRIAYACIAISDDAVVCYRRYVHRWKYERTLADDSADRIFSLNLSPDERYLIAMIAYGYKLWNLRTDLLLHLRLPEGVRNIPSKNCMNNLIIATKDSRFVVAAVRHNLYVWSVSTGDLVKTLGAHFGRIMALDPISKSRISSSSIDKSIKVWNLENILEEVHAIDRLEKSIEELSLSADATVAVTTTRSCVGVWNLETGRVMQRLVCGQHTTRVTHSIVTSDARFVVSSESGFVHTWEIPTGKLQRSDVQDEVQQLLLLPPPRQRKTSTTDEAGEGKSGAGEPTVIAISERSLPSSGRGRREGGGGGEQGDGGRGGGGRYSGLCIARAVPSGRTIFQFDFGLRNARYKNSVISSDGHLLVILSGSSESDGAGATLLLHDTSNGVCLSTITPRYPYPKEVLRIVALPGGKRPLVALIDDDKGNVVDLKKKTCVRSVLRWNGVSSSSGSLGLYAPDRGGLELLDLKTGSTVRTLIPRVAEGVFSTISLFTADDRHVVYYHSGRRSIRVFRVSDGKQIADYKGHAEIKVIASSMSGSSVVLGAVDGSVVVLALADPTLEDRKTFIASLQSRRATKRMSLSVQGAI